MVWHRVGAQVATGVARRDGGRMAEKGGQEMVLLEPAMATFAFVAELLLSDRDRFDLRSQLVAPAFFACQGLQARLATHSCCSCDDYVFHVASVLLRYYAVSLGASLWRTVASVVAAAFFSFCHAAGWSSNGRCSLSQLSRQLRELRL